MNKEELHKLIKKWGISVYKQKFDDTIDLYQYSLILQERKVKLYPNDEIVGFEDLEEIFVAIYDAGQFYIQDKMKKLLNIQEMEAEEDELF